VLADSQIRDIVVDGSIIGELIAAWVIGGWYRRTTLHRQWIPMLAFLGVSVVFLALFLAFVMWDTHPPTGKL